MSAEKAAVKKKPIGQRLKRFFIQYKWLNLMVLPGIVYFIVFKYLPMLGIYMAFTNYKGSGGLLGIFTANLSVSIILTVSFPQFSLVD